MGCLPGTAAAGRAVPWASGSLAQYRGPRVRLRARVCAALDVSFLSLCVAINYHGRNGFFLSLLHRL